MRGFLLLAVMICPGLAIADSCQAPAGAAAGAEIAPRSIGLAWSAADGQALSVDGVLAREAYSRCVQARVVETAGYQKQTEFDNTPYRFNMKPGQKLSAEEFDAWMASRGIRIVRAKTDAEPAATAPVVGN